ncbi:MAG: hypothetical protein JW849_01120 [Phycisphaerae bacterium]|nr:hypothetical protein [Phycisphaerae bacterium]
MTDRDDDMYEGPDAADADLLDEDHIKLIPCPNCGEMVGEFAQQCPHCKHWISPSSAGPWAGKSLWWILLAAAGVVMFALLYAF